jgi:hypothetical protein
VKYFEPWRSRMNAERRRVDSDSQAAAVQTVATGGGFVSAIFATPPF